MYGILPALESFRYLLLPYIKYVDDSLINIQFHQGAARIEVNGSRLRLDGDLPNRVGVGLKVVIVPSIPTMAKHPQVPDFPGKLEFASPFVYPIHAGNKTHPACYSIR